jgi:1-acyl-sn-glycerol-3-phosphate acyltransferase
MNAAWNTATAALEVRHTSSARAIGEAVGTILFLILRTLIVAVGSVLALLEISLVAPFIIPRQRRAARARWLHRWCRVACRVLGITVQVNGRIPRSGFLVSNHLSYLDIIVISSLTPCVFVAKSDVAHWPLFGWLACAAGTIFADRCRRLAARAAANEIRQAINAGNLVVLFPEGTSSDGTTVLPFKSALLEPAIRPEGGISPADIRYELADGSVADEICYWRDMTLVPHLLNLFTKRGITANFVVGSIVSGCSNRKELARELHRQVRTLRS